MAVRVNKSIIIDGQTIELASLIEQPHLYIETLCAQFNESTYTKKPHETDEVYLKRLFSLLYYRQNRSSRRVDKSFVENKNNYDLKFNIIKRNKCRSRIMFKQSGNSYRLNNEYLDLLIDASKKKLVYKPKITDKLIGVELEFIGASNKLDEFCKKMTKLVGYSSFSFYDAYYHNDGSKWILGKDCSVRPIKNSKKYSPWMYGFELSSPILRLSSKKDMKILREVCDLIKSVFCAYTNRTCGTHIHMSFPVDKCDMTPVESSLIENKFLCHFVRSYRKSEASLFDKLVPIYRRCNNGRYCKTSNIAYMNSRYRKINMTLFKPNSENLHLEFRQLDGTLDADRIILWSKLQTMFVDNTMDTWRASKESNTEPELARLKLEDIIVSDIFDSDSSEELMKMSSMIK